MARPKKNPTEARSARVNLRLSPAEHLHLAEQAHAAGMAVTDYVRAVVMDTAAAQWKRAANENLKQTGKATSKATAAAIAKLKAAAPLPRRRSVLQPKPLDTATYNELRRQGVNLNQMMHHCHAMKLPPPPELADVLASIRAIIAANIPKAQR